MERDERSAGVLVREVGARVELDVVRRPMGREPEQRVLGVRAASDLGAVTPILRSEILRVVGGVEVAVRPSEVVAILHHNELFRGLLDALGLCEGLGPQLMETVAAVLHTEERLSGGVHTERYHIT